MLAQKRLAEYNSGKLRGFQVQNKKLLSGVGGWLAFLIFALMVLAPLFAVGSTYAEIIDAERLHPRSAGESDWWVSKVGLWCLTVVPLAIGFSVGYRLWKDHRPETVEFAISGLWIIAAWSIWSSFIVAFVIFDLSLESVSSALIRNAVSNVVAVSIWTLYLKRSIRVKNTYGVFDRTPGLSQGRTSLNGDDGLCFNSTNAERSSVMVANQGNW